MANQEIFTVRMQENGRITIPEPIRTLLGLKESDLVRFNIEKIA
jgi:AbrB family looped-hinge helix DNA binding protein